MIQLKTRSKAQSKSINKSSFSSHFYASNFVQSAPKSQLIKTYQNNYLNHVLSLANDDLAQLFLQNVEKYAAKAIMHVGICLKFQFIIEFLKILGADKNLQIRTYIEQKKIYNIFIPVWHYKIQGCHIVFWLFQSSKLYEKSRPIIQTDRLLGIFSSFPQLLITDKESYKILSKKFIHFPQILKFEQRILIFQKDSELGLSNQLNTQQFRKIYKINQFDEKVFRSNVILTLKKNSQRCFNQTMEINILLISAINKSNPEISLNNPQIYSQFLKGVVAAFVNLEKFNPQTWAAKPTVPRQQNQLEDELNNKQEQILRKIRKNIKILSQSEIQKQILEDMQKKFLPQINITLQYNRKQGKLRNDNLLNELNQQFLDQFGKGKYTSSDRVSLIARDLQQFFNQYQKRSIKLNSSFQSFNNFMKQKKKTYYQNLQLVEEQIEQNKKSYSFDEIQDKLQMKKKVLYTVQKQVKQLQLKKAQIQSQNQSLKKLADTNQHRRLETQGEQQLYDQNTNKFLKTKTSNQQYTRAKIVNKYQKLYSNNQVEISKKNKTCFQCCKCTIF